MVLRQRGEGKGRRPEWQGPWPLLEGFRAQRGAVPVKSGETPEVKRGRRAYRVLCARERHAREREEKR